MILAYWYSFLKDWVVVDDRHEPLVTKALFQLAQERLGGDLKQTAGYVKSDNPLSRKVYCGVCGYAIVRRGKTKPYYCCTTPYSVPGLECAQEKIYAEDIFEAVIAAIRMQARCAVEFKRLADEQRSNQEALLYTLQKELQNLAAFQQQLSAQGEKLYEDLISGVLSRNDYAQRKATLLGETGTCLPARGGDKRAHSSDFRNGKQVH